MPYKTNLKTRPEWTKAFPSNITVSLNKPQEYYRTTKIPHKQVGKFTMSANLSKITIHAKKKTESKISSSINQSIKIGTELTLMIQLYKATETLIAIIIHMFKNQIEKIEHVRDMEKILKTQTELLEKKTL